MTNLLRPPTTEEKGPHILSLGEEPQRERIMQAASTPRCDGCVIRKQFPGVSLMGGKPHQRVGVPNSTAESTSHLGTNNIIRGNNAHTIKQKNSGGKRQPVREKGPMYFHTAGHQQRSSETTLLTTKETNMQVALTENESIRNNTTSAY